jgi:ATP/maltotriose-dependent transcriptional regulator MalT
MSLVSVDAALADLAREDGDLAEARRLAEEALRGALAIPGGPPQLVVMVQSILATLDADQGDPDLGRDRIRETVAMPMADRDMPVMGAVALAAAYVELRADRPEDSARLFGAALALRGTEERGSPQVELLRRELTAALGRKKFDRFYNDGATLPRQQATDLVRGSAVD